METDLPAKARDYEEKYGSLITTDKQPVILSLVRWDGSMIRMDFPIIMGNIICFLI
jgi:hypothetical protein